ncbi:MAG TPA: NADH-quinone oxidoreductase subunit L [Candidatus Acidoferrales bacterium]|jgi:NADH-quinone oxidoreductase subunit L|nr:NADH-quinone oxidoreductase subunit L [Candidatus Acidoferrales bacterium]
MPILENLWIIPLLPLLGSAINGLFGAKWSKAVVNSVALGSTGVSFLCAVEAVREFLAGGSQPFRKEFFDWIVAGSFRAGFDLQLDQLTVVMVLVVTGVGFLIHIYSTGYMAHEEGYYRFFSYLNLFMFFMLILVLAANYVLLFVGWEGVGLCSYLLIGFYFLRKSAADAGKKAFIVNRIGDFGFMLGMFLLFRTFHSLDFATVFDAASKPEVAVEPMGQFGVLTVACLLLFVGAIGKSAQLPLYVWLPDAMEGPTPVSALIHAATMVTAGVYMVARSHVLFTHAPTAMYVVAIVGCATAFFAATIGLVQSDIKKVLAYSTVSQLGYMFLACGVGAFGAGIFHLMTHAFFKALLFLSAGSVIHAMGGEQDMWNMGGLSKKIKATYWCMLFGTIAIAGFPPFAAFFSKDSILFAAYNSENGGKVLYGFGLLAAVLTSFYMFRLIWLTFYGEKRYDEHKVHVHESPGTMTAPLMILAFLSLTGGWFALPALFGGKDYFAEFLSPVFGAGEVGGGEAAQSLEHVLSIVAVVAATAGLLVAWRMYSKKVKRGTSEGVHKLLYNKYYVDELYATTIVRPLVWLSTNVLWKVVDAGMIDGAVNGVADGAAAVGDTVRHTQSGNTRSYAVWVVVGAIVILGIVFWPILHPALFEGVR